MIFKERLVILRLMQLKTAILLILFLFFSIAHADKSDLDFAEILSLHPTQFAIGFNEVDAKKEAMESMTPKKLEKFLRKKAIPVVVGPNNQLYMTDHHHHAKALFKMGIKTAFIVVLKDWSDQTVAQFWKSMKRNGFGYLYNEDGQGPLSPALLPNDIRKLKNDPYRGLAWFVEQHGAIVEVEQAYASFAWANYFRTRINRRILDNDLEKAIDLGVELAQSDEAAHLPGYIGLGCAPSFSRARH
jgi:hypothetical protein